LNPIGSNAPSSLAGGPLQYYRDEMRTTEEGQTVGKCHLKVTALVNKIPGIGSHLFVAIALLVVTFWLVAPQQIACLVNISIPHSRLESIKAK